MSRSRIISGILTALFLVTGGCHNNSTPPPSNPPPPPAAPGYSAGIRHDSPQPATGPADEDIRGTAEVLAQKAANYAKTVEPLLNQRGGASTEPSVATAIDPDALSLGSQRANAHPRRTAANESRSVPPETKPAGATGQNAHSNGAESRTQIATTDGGIPPEISASPSATWTANSASMSRITRRTCRASSITSSCNWFVARRFRSFR